MFLFCLVFAMFCARLFICALWSPAGKGLTSWLSFVVSSVSLSLSHWYPGSGVVLDCIDSWSLHHYLLLIHWYAIKRVQGQANSKRQPITASVLDKMCSLLNLGYLTVYMDCMLVAVCLTAFFGFLRCAEFTVMMEKILIPTSIYALVTWLFMIFSETYFSK